MSKTFCLIFMIFCHVIDDYKLQGILSSMKQKEWWKQNAHEPLYRFDYIMALLMHSISWSFMIMLPIAVYYKFHVGLWYLIFFCFNVAVHAFVDNKKANDRSINLITDQCFHLLQIAITSLFCIGW